jgi:uncharacterized protein YdiU (UPF0061 family)
MEDTVMEGIIDLTRQPDICKWNLNKLAEVWDHSLKKEISQSIVNELYDLSYESFYYLLNCHKLGINYSKEEDKKLIDELYSLYNDFGFDLTLFFRYLADVNDNCESVNNFSDKILKYSLPFLLIVQKKRPTVSESTIKKLLEIKDSNY